MYLFFTHVTICRMSMTQHVLPTMKTPAVLKKTSSRTSTSKKLTPSPQPASPPSSSIPDPVSTPLDSVFTPRSVALMNSDTHEVVVKPSATKDSGDECDKENVAVTNAFNVNKSPVGKRKLRSNRRDVLVPKEVPVRRVTRASEKAGVLKSPPATQTGKVGDIHEPTTEVAPANTCTNSSTTAKRQTRSRAKCNAMPPATPLSPLLRSQRKRLCTVSPTTTTGRTLRSASVATKTTANEVAMSPECMEKDQALTPPNKRTNSKKTGTHVISEKTRPNSPPTQPVIECNSPQEQGFTAMSTAAMTQSNTAVVCADSVDHTRTFNSTVQVNLVQDAPSKVADESPSMEVFHASDCVMNSPATATAQHACMTVTSVPGYSTDSDSGIGSVQSKDDGERRSTTSLEKQLRSVSLQRALTANTDML